ncbi:Hpt domain-containing protein [Acidisarcina polymorpha]|uniref:Hpt domain-containing protein n=1 Tax=Acidisarcina polymorpha TaxID=2211140 RepID=UPI0039C888F1
MYLEDTAVNLHRLKEAAASNDMHTISMALHALKGSSRQIGGLTLGNMLEAAEECFRARGMAGVDKSFPGLEVAFTTLRLEMESMIIALEDRHCAE